MLSRDIGRLSLRKQQGLAQARSPQAASQCFQSGISFLFSKPTPVGFFLLTDRFPHAASAPPNTRWLLSPLCTSVASSAAPAHRHVHSGSWRSAHNGGRPRYHPHQHGSICLHCAHGLFIWHNHFFREHFSGCGSGAAPSSAVFALESSANTDCSHFWHLY